MEKILNWYWDLVKQNKSTYKQINLKDCSNWHISKNIIKHKSKLFFKVVGLKVTPCKKLLNRQIWEQPVLLENNYKGGILGIIKKKINNSNFYLLQGKFEPGNINGVQISPTVQSTFSSIKFNKEKINFLNFFIKKKFKKNIIFKRWVSEDGGRFYKKKNLVLIYELQKNDKINLNKNFIWISQNDLIKLNFYPKPIVNPHVRSILSFLIGK